MKYIYSLIILFCISSLLNAQKTQFNALVFSKTTGYRHTSISDGVSAFKQMAEEHLFSMTWTEDANIFNTQSLEQFDVVVFLNTSGNILNEAQKSAFKEFIRNGKGFMGVHAASTTLNDWPWFVELLGGTFKSHPFIQSAKINVTNHRHPATLHLNQQWLWTDEWYVFENLNDNIKILLTVDENLSLIHI